MGTSTAMASHCGGLPVSLRQLPGGVWWLPGVACLATSAALVDLLDRVTTKVVHLLFGSFHGDKLLA